ncbi:MAG: transcriptional repressor [Agathobacter sp.]|uniref:Fur family transcriptional regulator n=1 Tax=Agathobacter sp. TaxID=2021311 RepID=UPI002586A1E3|nr:transcriptional repressor [Agathobacter sp.]MCR5678500.1 transcriptional repressor [Agathobacter sp.]
MRSHIIECMKGKYKTKSRNLIIDYLKAHADRRFTAHDLTKEFEAQGERVDRSTIYRNLERLSREGTLVRYKENATNATCFQYSEMHGQCHSHIHAQCEVCGKIYHLKNDIFRSAEKKLHEQYGISLDFGQTVLSAICDSCKTQEKTSDKK